jgi:hypothetical protein
VRGQLGEQRADRDEAVGSREQRPKRLVAEDLGRQHGPLGQGHVRGVAQQRVELVGHPLQQVGVHPRDLQPELGAVGAGAAERRLAHVAARHPQVGTLVLERQRDGARAGAEVEHGGAAGQAETDLDQQLALRTRDQGAGVDGQLQAAKAAAPEDIGDRLALDRAPAHGVLEDAHRGTGDEQVTIGAELLAPDAKHVREQQFCVQAGGFAAGGGDRGDRAVERVTGRGAGVKRRVHRRVERIAGASGGQALVERLRLQTPALLVGLQRLGQLVELAF